MYMRRWLLGKFETQATFDKNSILVGKYKEKKFYKVHNLLNLITKQYIFASRYKEVPKLNFSAFENIIKNRISVEKYILLKYFVGWNVEIITVNNL